MCPKASLGATQMLSRSEFWVTFLTWLRRGSPGRAQGGQMTPPGYQNDSKCNRIMRKTHSNYIKIVPKPFTNNPQHNNSKQIQTNKSGSTMSSWRLQVSSAKQQAIVESKILHLFLTGSWVQQCDDEGTCPGYCSGPLLLQAAPAEAFGIDGDCVPGIF